MIIIVMLLLLLFSLFIVSFPYPSSPSLLSQVNPKIFAIGDCSSIDSVKIGPKIKDQVPTLVSNVIAKVEGRSLANYKKGFFGSLPGPLLVALGHGHAQGYGLGPNLTGCPGCCIWICCCCGPPCAPPAGAGPAKIKSDFNKSVKPQVGKGMDAK